MSDGTTATASGMDTHKRWFLLDYEPTSVRVCSTIISKLLNNFLVY